MRGKDEVLALSKYLNGDLFIIGGAETYKTFAEVIDKWIVTEIPETVEDADVFMRKDFLEGFELEETVELGDGLKVKIYKRIEH
jgi:dihydrofolate reductase